ncbi:hypothetical protein [Mycoavidus sp. B2-EB]|uniref:hypothetical protein n=1 Tax=Mycoavidus sp. B2-EB TaxID=2651972 RepID=UPI001624A05E|nr:hypothetical protein [Mycoavidus sp. B2-EB]
MNVAQPGPGPKAKRPSSVLSAAESISETASVKEAGDGHEHGHGAVMVDLDEAVHAVYILLKKLIEAGRASGDETLTWFKELQEEAELLKNAPLEHAAHQVSPTGGVDFGVSMGSSGLISVLALFAIREGLRARKTAAAEYREKSGQARKLGKEIKKLDGLIQEIEKLLHTAEMQDALGDVCALAKQTRLCKHQKLQDTQFSREMKRLDKKIGGASLASGSTILAKALAESVTQIGLAASAHQLDVAQLIAQGLLTSSAATTATAVGTASTLVLGPAAALGATALGAYFVKKSRKQKQQIQQGKASVDAAWAKLRADIERGTAELSAIDDYLKFLGIKLAQREEFAKSFLKWNSGFLTGSTVYAGSTLAKMGLTVASLAGAGAAANPVGLGVLLAATIAGGLTMTVCSQQFLHSHDKQKRYDDYQIEDDLELDKDFLATVDIKHEQGEKKGLELRSRFYQQAQARETVRQNLLAQVALENQKRYRWIPYSTDREKTAESEKPPVSKLSSFKKSLYARWQASAEFTKKLITSHDYKAAREIYQQVRAEKRSGFGKRTLKQWLDQAGNDAAQIAFMQQALGLQLAYLEQKHKVQLELRSAYVNAGAIKSFVEDDSIQIGFDSDLQVRDELMEELKDLAGKGLDIPEGLSLQLAHFERKCDAQSDFQLAYLNQADARINVETIKNFVENEDIQLGFQGNFIRRDTLKSEIKSLNDSQQDIPEELSLQLAHLERQCDLQLDLQLAYLNLDSIDTKPINTFLKGIETRLGFEKGIKLHDEVRSLLKELEESRLKGQERSPENLLRLKESFMLLQQGRSSRSRQKLSTETAQPTIDCNLRFAEYLLEIAPKRYRDLRGKLIGTEIQAARLRELAGQKLNPGSQTSEVVQAKAKSSNSSKPQIVRTETTNTTNTTLVQSRRSSLTLNSDADTIDRASSAMLSKPKGRQLTLSAELEAWHRYYEPWVDSKLI